MVIGNIYSGSFITGPRGNNPLMDRGAHASGVSGADAPAPGPVSQETRNAAGPGTNAPPPDSDAGPAMSLRQAARIVSMMATMQNVDEVSAYSLVGGNEASSDQFRQAVAAYQNV